MVTCEPKVMKVAHKLGKHYVHGILHEDYVLTQTSPGQMALIGIDSGNRYNNPIQVKNVFDVTIEEFGDISRGGIFTRAEEMPNIKPIPGVCICKKIEIPEVVPNISVGFRYKGTTVLCYVQVQNKLRVGVCRYDSKDTFRQHKGEKIALKRALAQHKICCIVRKALWAQYLYSQGIATEPDPIISFFKNRVTCQQHGLVCKKSMSKTL
jgi:hypothetical protein